MDAEIKGLVFDVQQYSIHDGPGIRSVVFLKGCPLKCRWCSNPESQSMKKQMMHSKIKCKQCGRCVEACAANALLIVNGQLILDRDKCDLCGQCVDACFFGAWKSAGEWYTVDKLLPELLKDEICFFASGGGVTIGGGEPLVQHEFVMELISACQSRGVHTVIETCGYADQDVFREVALRIDLLLMDLKHTDPQKHLKYTGKSNEQILQNWETAAEVTKEVICRVPVIPGFNDTAEEIKSIIDFAASIGLKNMHLLPYHRMGEGKYESIGEEYQMHGITPLPDEKMNEFLGIALGAGLNAQIGG